MTDTKTATPNVRNEDSASPANAPNHGHGIDMELYRATVPLWKRVWQHSLTQMMILSVQSFCGPAMSDAITGKYTIRLESPEYGTNHFQAWVVVVSQLLRCQILRTQLDMPCLLLVCIPAAFNSWCTNRMMCSSLLLRWPYREQARC